jgi:tripartite-type tricarboxylate transporter receptor subunit TctC
MLAPRGTPNAIVSRLSAAVRGILKEPETEKRFTAMGLEIIASTPDEFRRDIADDVKRWAKVVKDANIKVD